METNKIQWEDVSQECRVRIMEFVQSFAKPAFEHAARKGIKYKDDSLKLRLFLRDCETVFSNMLKRKTEEIFAASQEKMTLGKIKKLANAKRRENMEVIKENRRDMAGDLRSARAKLELLHRKIKAAECKLAMPETYTMEKRYPAVPAPIPHLVPNIDGNGLPESPGVYFLWCNNEVEYVGMSVRLNKRVRFPYHHVLRQDHLISFLNFEDQQAAFKAERWYIGLLQPKYNGT